MFTLNVFIQFHSGCAFLGSTSRYTFLFCLKDLGFNRNLSKIAPQNTFSGRAILILALDYVWKFRGYMWPTFQSWQFFSESTDGALLEHHRSPFVHNSQAITLVAWPCTNKFCVGSQKTMLLELLPNRCFSNIYNRYQSNHLHSSSSFLVLPHYQWKSQCILNHDQKFCFVLLSTLSYSLSLPFYQLDLSKYIRKTEWLTSEC